MIDKRYEPFGGRYHGIWNVESDDDPIAVFPNKDSADRELKRRQALPDGHDDRLNEYNHVFPCYLYGAWWNSHDSQKHTARLSIGDVVGVHEGAA